MNGYAYFFIIRLIMSNFFSSTTATAEESMTERMQTTKNIFGTVPRIVFLLSEPKESDDREDKKVSFIRKLKKPLT